jgi:acyl carrier protein
VLRVAKTSRALVWATRKATPMNSPSESLVYVLIAATLQTDDAFKNTDLLGELGLDAVDLVRLAMRLEELEPQNGAFPLAELSRAKTMGDLVELVDAWLQDDTIPIARNGVPTQRSVG